MHPPAFLTSPQFWSALKWALIVVLLLATLNAYRALSKSDARSARAEAVAVAERKARQAEELATIKSDFRACLRSVPLIAGVRQFVSGVNRLTDTLIRNSARLAAATGDAQAARAQNLQDLRAVKRLVGAVHFEPVSERDCWNARNAARQATGRTPLKLPARLTDRETPPQ